MEIDAFYEKLHEEDRLVSKSHLVEFLTTWRMISSYRKPGTRILEIGAGTGMYSLKLAREGYQVDAVELLDRHVAIMKSQIDADMRLHAQIGNALDLSVYEDETFDLVLCLGPLYHLHGDEQKGQCIEEAKRVCKKGGTLIFAYLSNDMVMMTQQFLYDENHLTKGPYQRDTFQLDDDVFCFMTVTHARTLFQNHGLPVIKEVAADGPSELLGEKIDAFSDEQFEIWMKYHEYVCEKPELLGFSNHILYITEKG